MRERQTGQTVPSVDLTELIIRPNLCEERASALQRRVAFETVRSRGWLEGTKQYGRYFLSTWLYGLRNPGPIMPREDEYDNFFQVF